MTLPLKTKRGRFHIAYEILSFCKKPKLKTRIMQKCNLSHSGLHEYLNLLISHDLLTSFARKNRKVYQITQTGFRFITAYEELTKLLVYKINRL